MRAFTLPARWKVEARNKTNQQQKNTTTATATTKKQTRNNAIATQRKERERQRKGRKGGMRVEEEEEEEEEGWLIGKGSGGGRWVGRPVDRWKREEGGLEPVGGEEGERTVDRWILGRDLDGVCF